MSKPQTDTSIIDWRQPLKESCQSSLIAAAVFSGIANLLMLVPAFFMLNVYDKAIGATVYPLWPCSRSLPYLCFSAWRLWRYYVHGC